MYGEGMRERVVERERVREGERVSAETKV